MKKHFYFFVLIVHTNSVFAQSQDSTKAVRIDNYIDKYISDHQCQNCYCSTQNSLEIALTIDDKLYPYRGDFAKASNEKLFKERIKVEVFDSIKKSYHAPSYESIYYGRYWDPELASQTKNLVDIVVTKLFNKETEYDFNKVIFDTAHADIKSILVPQQKHTTIQYGHINNYPNLKYHWYSFSIFDTQLEDSDLGVYYQVTHFFSWSGKTYSVVFNYDHMPTNSDKYKVHHFLFGFGKRCNLDGYSKDQLISLDETLRLVYADTFELLFGMLSEEEKGQVVSCSKEKIGQIYSYNQIVNGDFNEEIFIEILTGCIEYMKL